jgi:hypothetical protein
MKICPERSSTIIRYQEVAGALHWWDTVFTNDKVQKFLDDVVQSGVYKALVPNEFVLTVAIPEESGSLHGLQIRKLGIPGRIGRIKVILDDRVITLATVNVLEYSFKVPTEWQGLQLVTDGTDVSIPHEQTILLASKQHGRWQVRHWNCVHHYLLMIRSGSLVNFTSPTVRSSSSNTRKKRSTAYRYPRKPRMLSSCCGPPRPRPSLIPEDSICHSSRS